jgi:hypothetical protein
VPVAASQIAAGLLVIGECSGVKVLCGDLLEVSAQRGLAVLTAELGPYLLLARSSEEISDVIITVGDCDEQTPGRSTRRTCARARSRSAT